MKSKFLQILEMPANSKVPVTVQSLTPSGTASRRVISYGLRLKQKPVPAKWDRPADICPTQVWSKSDAPFIWTGA
jgi:hypothetical protein